MFGIESVYVKSFLILLLLIPFVIAVGDNKQKSKRTGILFLFAVLFLFAAFRAETVGGDLEYYIPHFREMCTVNGFSSMFSLSSSNYEPGYTILCWFISRLSDSVFVFLSITSFISLIGPFFVAQKFSVWPCVSIFIYIMLGFYTNTYNNIRQSIAISIILYSIPFIIEKKTVKFLMIVALAGSIHTSALVFVFAYVVRYIPLSFKSFFVSLAAGYAVSTLSGIVVVQYFGAIFLSKYEELFTEGHGKTLMIIYVFITLCALVIYKRNQLKREDESITLFIRFMLIASIIQMFSIYFFSVVRLTYYFFIPVIVLLPNLTKLLRNHHVKTIGCIVVFLVLLYYMTTVYSYIPETNSNSQGVIPYRLNF